MLKVLLSLLCFAGSALPALADTSICLPGDTPLTFMQKTHEEPAVGMDISFGKSVFEPAMILKSADGKWTLLFRNPNGMTCILAVGEHLVVLTPTEKP